MSDLASLPGVEVAAVARTSAVVREGGWPSGVERLPPAGTPDATLRSLLSRRGFHAVWLIAPETRGILEGLSARVEAAGAVLVGPSAAAVARAADRSSLLRGLAAAGLPVPPSRVVRDPAAAARAAAELGFPVVVKPGRGAGGEGLRLVRRPEELPAALAAATAAEPDRPPLLQPLLSGTAASVTLLAAGEDVRPVALGRQLVELSPRARYRGGTLPLEHPRADRARRLAAAAVRRAGGMRGLVGVDLLLGRRGVVLLELNPRLTTSYLGLRQLAGARLAAAGLAAAGWRGEAGEPPELPLRGPPVAFGPGAGGTATAGRRG